MAAPKQLPWIVAGVTALLLIGGWLQIKEDSKGTIESTAPAEVEGSQPFNGNAAITELEQVLLGVDESGLIERAYINSDKPLLGIVEVSDLWDSQSVEARQRAASSMAAAWKAVAEQHGARETPVLAITNSSGVIATGTERSISDDID